MDDLDHRNLGVKLKLWHLQEDAPGMVFWHPRGYALYRVLEDYVRRKMRGAGYAEVRTPQLLPKEFWDRSGHWDKFGGHMFRVDDGQAALALKPMSCPCHVQIFNKGLRSWRELPIRYAEFGACHRNEPSGSLHGIMRTRAFEQDDAHVFCREQDVEGEVAGFIALLGEVYRELGFPDYEVALATRPALRAGDDATWDWSEAKLGDAARRCGLEPHINPGEGAFYGPKLEFALRDRLGRSWQCGTVQLDGVLPQRLEASYIAPDGSRAKPLMIHHAIFGSISRMIAILLEHHGGVLPFWLSPDQVAVAPITKDQAGYGAEVVAAFEDAGIRAVAYDGADTLSRRIMAAHEMAVPVMAIVGGREMRDGRVSLRERDGSQVDIPLAEAVSRLQAKTRPGASVNLLRMGAVPLGNVYLAIERVPDLASRRVATLRDGRRAAWRCSASGSTTSRSCASATPRRARALLYADHPYNVAFCKVNEKFTRREPAGDHRRGRRVLHDRRQAVRGRHVQALLPARGGRRRPRAVPRAGEDVHRSRRAAPHRRMLTRGHAQGRELDLLRALHGGARRGGRHGHGDVAAEEDLPHLPRGRSQVGDAAHARTTTSRSSSSCSRRTRGAARWTASSTPTTRTRRSRSSTRTTPTRRSATRSRAPRSTSPQHAGRHAERALPARRRPDRHPGGGQRRGRVVLPREPGR